MVVAQQAPAGGQGLLLELAGALQVAEGCEGLGEVVHRRQGVGVVLAEHPSVGGQSLLVEVVGASEVP